MEESLFIGRYQVAKHNCLDIGNIDNVNKDVISLWQEVIRRGGQLPKEDIDMNYNQDNSNISSYDNLFTRILKPIIDAIKISEKYLTKVEYNHLSKNPKAVIL